MATKPIQADDLQLTPIASYPAEEALEIQFFALLGCETYGYEKWGEWVAKDKYTEN
jgi:hypothetical protein